MWETSDDEEDGRAGYIWMEGDSLAPPYGADKQIVSTIVDMARPFIGASDDLLVDLGCGDVRLKTVIRQCLLSRSLFLVPCSVFFIHLFPFNNHRSVHQGRICVAASQQLGCRSLGCEIEDVLIERFHKKVAEHSLAERITVVHGDLRDVKLLGAAVIVLYLLPESVELIIDALVEAVRAGTILICNTWGPKTMQPVSRIHVGPCNVTLLLYDSSSLPA